MPRGTNACAPGSADVVARAVAERRLHGRPGGASERTIAQGAGWRVADIVCCADAGDPLFEERHDYVSIALVLAGAFTYRSSAGCGCLQTGSILLGGSQVCFSCGHEHGAGDRCIAFQFSPRCFEDILSALAAPRTRLSFPRVALAAARSNAALFADAEALAWSTTGEEYDLALRAANWVLEALEVRAREPAPRPAQARAMAEIARTVEAEPGAEHSTETLARRAQMSPFHFIRCFKRVVGVTPHAFVRIARLRDAVRLLRDPALSIASIAFESGFQDLSAFNAAFRQAFDTNPKTMRARWAQRAKR